MSVDYGRPSVNGRAIWGELVPYGFTDLGWAGATHAPWRAGADENTIVSFEHDVAIEGNDLPAGAYGLHMVPMEDGKVLVILSENTTSWGSYFYNPEEDALRVEVMSEECEHHEMLTYDFDDVSKNKATISLSWEKKRIPISIEVDTDEVVVASLKDSLRSTPGFRYQNIINAVNYLLDNNIELELALEWAEISINRPFIGRRNQETLDLKARVLEKLGRNDEASELREEIANL